MASLKPYTITITAEPGDLLTVEQYAALPEEPGWKTELVEGKVVRMTLASYDHGRIVFRLIALVGAYILAHDLGDGTPEQSGYNIGAPGKRAIVRAPDFAFMNKENAAKVKGVLYPRIAPDLVAEVVSPSQNTQEEMERRAQMWMGFGVRLVWIIWPDERSVDVWQPNQETQRLSVQQKLDGLEMLPGFTLEIAKLFS
jgi:Uma2 family endonuclease